METISVLAKGENKMKKLAIIVGHESDYEEYLKNKSKLVMVFTQYILDFIYGG